MADKEVPSGGQMASEMSDHLDPGVGIEIDHDIPAEDDVLILGHRVVGLEEVDPVEPHLLAELPFDPDPAGLAVDALLEVPLEEIGWDLGAGLVGIDGGLRPMECPA